MIEPEVLFDKLASMETYREIVNYCEAEQVKGITQEETSCALAVLFRKSTSAEVVKVGGEHIEWSKNSDCWSYIDESGWGESRKLTSAMEVFIRNFDQGDYPQLQIPIEDYE